MRGPLTLDEAHALVREHVGPDCEIGLWVANRDDPDSPEDIFWVHSEMRIVEDHPTLASPIIAIGSTELCLPPMPGRIYERDDGLEFELAPDVVLRVAWGPPGGHGNGKPDMRNKPNLDAA